MAWTPIPHPYDKYVNEDPNAYTSVDPDLVKQALAKAGLGDAANSGIFTNYQNMTGPVGSAPATPSGATAPSTGSKVDYRALIQNDPFYQQAQADLNAQGISDAASRAAALKKTLIDWGVIPDWSQAADQLGLSPDVLDYLKQDIDPNTAQYAAMNEQQGLSRHARLAAANQQNVDAIRNQLAARGMYQSGELGYGLTQNEQQYKQASTDALSNVLGSIQEIGSKFTQGAQDRARQLGQAATDAAGRVDTAAGSTDLSGTTNPTRPAAQSSFVLPAKTASVWDVNSASTYDALNAAKQSGGSLTIRPDDPEAVTKANAAAQAGVPVSIQVNGSGDDTPATLAARVQQYSQQFPGASFTLDLESPNFRDMTPGAMEAYAQAVQQVAGNTPIVLTTEGVSDFNYGAWASNPNVIFAPQAYWGDMTPRDVSQVVSLLTAQGIPANRIIPVVAPGQSLGSYTGPVSVYGAPSQQQAASFQTSTPYEADTSTPIGEAQQNAITSSQTYSPETIQQILQQVAYAYQNPDPVAEVLKSGGIY